MASITLPIWQPAGAIALPCIILFILTARLLWKKRRLRKSPPGFDAAPEAAPEAYGNRIHQEMVAQQIDAVFNALNAVIEAERVKLKALLLHQWDGFVDKDQSAGKAGQRLQSAEKDDLENLGRRYLLNEALDRVPSTDLAEEDHLSRNEAALARKLQCGTGQKRPRLETMA